MRALLVPDQSPITMERMAGENEGDYDNFNQLIGITIGVVESMCDSSEFRGGDDRSYGRSLHCEFFVSLGGIRRMSLQLPRLDMA